MRANAGWGTSTSGAIFQEKLDEYRIPYKRYARDYGFVDRFLGVDLESDEDQYKMWYSMDFDVVRLRSEFKYGVQIALPAEVVKFTV